MAGPSSAEWEHTQEVQPGGSVATVARVSSSVRVRTDRRPTPPALPADEETGAGDGPHTPLVAAGGGGLHAPLLAGGGDGLHAALAAAAAVGGAAPYDPPTLPIIPPPLRPPSPAAAEGAARAALATRVSLAANILLLAAKVAAFLISRSRAVQASATDSLVDLASQVLLAWAAAAAAPRADARYPVGKARASTLGVAGAAATMIAATCSVVVAAGEDLWEGLVNHSPPALEVGPILFAVLLGGTALKAGLFIICERAARTAPPGAGDTLSALAEDHRTDALTNVVAAAASAAVAFGGPRAWAADPVAALALSAYILAVWSRIFSRTVAKIVGRAAPADVMAALEAVVEEAAAGGGGELCGGGAGPGALANPAPPGFSVDVLKAWFSGDALLCECEIVMHPATPLRRSHDVALGLQHALEAVRVGDVGVERAYVHVDWARRAEPEHAPDRAAAAAGPG